MTENLKKLLDEAGKNEELKAKLAALTDRDTAVEETVEIAREYGITLTAEDFLPDEDRELSLDELDAVAGGDVCVGVGFDRPSYCTCMIVGAQTCCGCFIIGTN